MKNCNTDGGKTIIGGLLIACITAMGVVFTSTLSHAAQIESQSQAFHAENIAAHQAPGGELD